MDLVHKNSTEFCSGFKGFGGFEGLEASIHAIDWTEPWVICLVVFHVTLLMTQFMSRKNISCQKYYSIVIAAGFFLAKPINNFLGEHWKSFARVNYFDTSCLFFSILWFGPFTLAYLALMVNCLVILLRLLIDLTMKISGRKAVGGMETDPEMVVSLLKDPKPTSGTV